MYEEYPQFHRKKEIIVTYIYIEYSFTYLLMNSELRRHKRASKQHLIAGTMRESVTLHNL